MRSDSGFTLYLLLLLVFGFAAHALIKESHCPKSTNIKLKQLQILQVVSTINKPIPKEIRSAYNIIEKYKLKDLGRLPKGVVFSLFDERNWNETTHVLELLLEAKTFDDFIKTSQVILPLVNEELFFYAFSVALTHRKDTHGLQIPRVHRVFPDKFLKTPVIMEMKKLTRNAQRAGKYPIVEGNDMSHIHNYLDTHDELAYFTEDLGMNSHHYHWHVINPAVWKTQFGNYSDRKGELFYWMHSQMVARYDIERLSNNLPRISPFQSFNDEIEEGYNPHLTMEKTHYHYAYRPPHFVLQDLPNLPKSKLHEWATMLFHAVHTGYLTRENGSKVSLNNTHGIDELGNTVEANYDSVNHDLYGNIHCYAHVIAAKITDPTSAYMEDNGVMYDVATSARDPLFYRWHKFINRFFEEHKRMLKPYTREELSWKDVKIEKISIQNPTSTPNLIRTYWQDSFIKVREGFEFTKESPAYVKLTHLDHETFNYRIDVNNVASSPKSAVVRIFMAPVYDEFERPLDVKHQRTLMIQMDKFVTKLEPGKNTIVRSSQNSSVTMDSKSIFDEMHKSRSDDNCRCGWPDYLLVPKGKYEGMKFQLFVMLSDWTKDEAPTRGHCFCEDSFTYCGGIDAKYRDLRPMGFPIDRQIKARKWDDFETENMAHTFVTVKFVGDTLNDDTHELTE